VPPILPVPMTPMRIVPPELPALAAASLGLTVFQRRPSGREREFSRGAVPARARVGLSLLACDHVWVTMPLCPRDLRASVSLGLSEYLGAPARCRSGAWRSIRADRYPVSAGTDD